MLKDAASTAFYGYQGGNGVVVINTKKSTGERHLQFSTRFGIQQMSQRYRLMNSNDFFNTLHVHDTLVNPWFYRYKDNKIQRYPYDTTVVINGNPVSTNWQNKLFGTGLLNQYQLAGSGAIKNVNFYLSGNVFTNEGVVKNSDYRRYAFNGNLNRQFNSRFGMNLTYRASRQSNRNNLENYLGNSLIYKGINIEPGFNATPDSFLLKKKRLYYNPDVGDFDPSGSLSILSNTTLNLDSLLQHTKKQDITSQAMNVSGLAKFCQ